MFALLIAQAGAQAHAYSHLRSISDPSGLPGAPAQLCSECLLFAPLLATADCHDSPSVCQLGGRAVIVAARAVSLVNTVGYYAFRSRAPPVLF